MRGVQLSRLGCSNGESKAQPLKTKYKSRVGVHFLQVHACTRVLAASVERGHELSPSTSVQHSSPPSAAGQQCTRLADGKECGSLQSGSK